MFSKAYITQEPEPHVYLCRICFLFGVSVPLFHICPLIEKIHAGVIDVRLMGDVRCGTETLNVFPHQLLVPGNLCH